MAPRVAYNFDAGSGATAPDLSGNGLTCTVGGYTTGHTSFGAVGDASHSAFGYTGSTFTPTVGWTVMAWVKPITRNAGDTVFFLASDAPANTWWFEVDWDGGNHLMLDVLSPGHGQQTAAASATTATGAYVHVAATWNASTGVCTLYVGAVAVATLTVSSAFGAPGIFEGGGWSFYGNFGTAALDDFRIDDSVLTQAQISTAMNTPVTGGGTPITASGTVSLTGAAALRAPIAGSGTVSLAGTGRLGGSARGAGTITLGGQAALGGRMAAAGTVTLGGSATLAAPGGALTASGQLLLGGGAALRAPVAAAGTVALGGQAALSTLSKMVASGGLALGGAASLRGALSAGGTIVLGGQAILFAGGSGDEMDEAEFWAQSSGLTPLRDYSTEEHQLAAMRAKLSLTGGSLDDVAPLYYGSLGYTGTVDEMEHAFWANLAGLSATAAYDSSQPDVKAQALATGPVVP